MGGPDEPEVIPPLAIAISSHWIAYLFSVIAIGEDWVW